MDVAPASRHTCLGDGSSDSVCQARYPPGLCNTGRLADGESFSDSTPQTVLATAALEPQINKATNDSSHKVAELLSSFGHRDFIGTISRAHPARNQTGTSKPQTNIGRRFRVAAALLPRLFGKNPRSHPVGCELETNGFQFYAIANF